MTIEFTTSTGDRSEKPIKLFALSTCGWCRKTKRFLESTNLTFDYVYVDKLTGEARDEVRNEVRKHNPRCSYPTVLIGDDCVVGYDESKMRELLEAD